MSDLLTNIGALLMVGWFCLYYAAINLCNPVTNYLINGQLVQVIKIS